MARARKAKTAKPDARRSRKTTRVRDLPPKAGRATGVKGGIRGESKDGKHAGEIYIAS